MSDDINSKNDKDNKAKIEKVKVWVTEHNAKEPKPDNLAIEKKIDSNDLDKDFVFDVWTDFVADGKEKRKETEISFKYPYSPPPPPPQEIEIDIKYSPKNPEAGTIVELDGTGTKPSSSNAHITSWFWSVRNEGGMNYPVTNATQPQASLTTPDLNWMYVSLKVTDSNGRNASKEIFVDIGEPQPHPKPVAIIKPDEPKGKENSTITLDGSESENTVSFLWTISDNASIVGSSTNSTVKIQLGKDDCEITLEVRNSVNDFDKTSRIIDVTPEEPPPPDNKPPIANAGNDQVVKPKTLVTLDGRGSSDPENLPLEYQWTQTGGAKVIQIINSNQAIATFTSPDVTPIPIEEAKAIINAPALSNANDTVTIDGTQSIADTLTLSQISGDANVTLNEISKWKWQFKAPDGDFTLGFRAIAKKGTTSTHTVQLSIQITKQPQGDVNEHGTRLLYRTTGKRVVMLKGTAHRNGQRYNVNIPKGWNVQNYMQIGYYKIATNQKQIELKTDGPNHGGCDQLPECMWYEPDLYVDGTVRLGMEYPHPDNHAVDNSLLEVNAPLKVGDLKGKWIGYAVCVYYNKEGLRVIEQWADPTPFDNSGKPLNNWQLTLRAIEKGQLFPKQYFPRELPTQFDEGLEIEIRMHAGAQTPSADFKWAYVYEIAQPNEMKKYGISETPRTRFQVCKPKELIKDIDEETGKCDHDQAEPEIKKFEWKTDYSQEQIKEELPKIPPLYSERYYFQLKVTDDKGLTAIDNVSVLVEEPDHPPPPNLDAKLKELIGRVDVGQSYTIDGSQSTGEITSWSITQNINDPVKVTLQDSPLKYSKSFIMPDTDEILHFTLAVGDANGQADFDSQTVAKSLTPPPPPAELIIGHIGDTHARSGGHDGIKNMFEREKVNFMLHSGDITDDESSADSYVNFMKSLGKVYGKDFANAQGNHSSPEESGQGAQDDMETAFPILKQTKWLQYYHIKNVVIIIGNTQLPNYSQIGSETSKHIQESLVKAKTALENGTADWVFFMQHKPMYVIRNASHEAEYNFRYVFHPLFDQYGLDIFLDGHAHLEHQTKPLIFGGDGTNIPPKINSKKTSDGSYDFGTVKPHGVMCCVNGSSTKSHSLDEQTNAWTDFVSDSGNAYTVFKINGKRLVGQYIDIATGKVRNEFKISKEGTIPPPPPPPPPPTGKLKFNISGDFRDTPESGSNLISGQPNLIVTTGDYGIATDETQWCNEIMGMWKNSNIETWGARGNHDSNKYLSLNFFKNTTWTWTLKKYSLAFVACDTITEDVADADKRLQECQNDSNIKKIIVLMHEPIFHSPNTSVSSDTTLEFHNTFKKYSKVKMVIAGHTHVFAMSKPIDNILYLINGIGGQNASSGSTSPSNMHKINGALHCVLNEDNSIKCDCVPNEGDAPNTMWSFTIGANGELPTNGVDFERRE